MKKFNVVKKYLEFREILDNGKFVNGKSFAIHYRLSQYDYERYGLLVTKKLGIAVTRNLIKRQVRMMIDKISDYKLPLDIIIVVKKNYNANSYLENETELTALLSNIRSQYEEKN